MTVSQDSSASKKRPRESSDYRSEAIDNLSRGILRVQQGPKQGAFVVANCDLHPGQVLLECPSATIALDPLYRETHCGYCARPIGRSNLTCQICHVLAICEYCNKNRVTQWHSTSGECTVLKALVESFRELLAEFEGLSLLGAAQKVESIHIVTVRLLHRRQLYQKQAEMQSALPEIDWELFDTLYSSPLPSDESSSSSYVTAMASLFQAMNEKLHENAGNVEPFDAQQCISIWSKCRGCCHAITDLSRPLGSQDLGMALFVPQSLYNHACAPNAFLSCLLPVLHEETASPNVPLCCVWSRTVCFSNEIVPQGESVALSYIPLSGLCRRERQFRLREGYHFECDCKMCQEALIINTSGNETERCVGGTFAAGVNEDGDLNTLEPLRELQITCHQQLESAATMALISNEPSTDQNEDPRTDTIEQSIATLEMAQRGIRNQKIPPSHEVSLECHRLLAFAYALLRKDKRRQENDIDQEHYHHEQFIEKAKPITAIFDPSALSIQHFLMAVCLQSRGEIDAGLNNGTIKSQYQGHVRLAYELAVKALGCDHPFITRCLPKANDGKPNTMDPPKID